MSKNRAVLDAKFLDNFRLHRTASWSSLFAKETQGKRRTQGHWNAMKRPKTFFWFAGVATLAGLPVMILLLILS